MLLVKGKFNSGYSHQVGTSLRSVLVASAVATAIGSRYVRPLSPLRGSGSWVRSAASCAFWRPIRTPDLGQGAVGGLLEIRRVVSSSCGHIDGFRGDIRGSIQSH